MRQPGPSRPPSGVAIIGCGYWGMNYVRLFSELGDAELLAVCDTQRERLDQVAKRYPSVQATEAIDEALEVPGVEVVVVATEAESHYEHVRAALQRGKHVLVEKPLTTRAAEALELAELADESKLVLLVGHTFLYNAGIRAVKDYVAGEELGSIYYLYSRRTNLGPFRNDVNAAWDLASHDIAIFNYLLDGRPLWVSAVAARVLQSDMEDVSFISLGYPGGVVAHVHASWAEPHKVREVVVVGSDQRIVFNDLDPVEQVRVFDKGVRLDGDVAQPGFGEHHFSIRNGAIVSPAIQFVEPLKKQSGHFLHCVRRGEAPLTNGRVGHDVVLVMEAIDESIARNGTPVTVGGAELDASVLRRATEMSSAIRDKQGASDARAVR